MFSRNNRSERRLLDLTAFDLDKVHGRYVLSAFLTGRALLDEVDVSVDALHLDIPQSFADRLRICLSGRLDCGDGDINGVKAPEILQSAHQR